MGLPSTLATAAAVTVDDDSREVKEEKQNVTMSSREDSEAPVDVKPKAMV